jgi:PEP-CTERM motif
MFNDQEELMFSGSVFSLKSFSLVMLFVAVFAIADKANADPITFDDPPSPGAVASTTATFQGFDFASTDGFNHVASGHFSAAVSHNGTSFLVVSPNSTGALQMSNNGQLFSLTSFDADTFVHIQGITTIVVTGTLNLGGTVTQTFLTDSIGDGPGPLVDFQTFSLVGFTDLVSVEFSGNKAFTVDNINVTGSTAPIPEPATIMLFGGGLMSMGAIARRRRKIAKRLRGQERKGLRQSAVGNRQLAMSVSRSQ